MQPYIQQSIAKILLFGGLLQGCQSPYVGGPSPCGSSRSRPVGHTQQRIHTRCSYPMHRPAPAVYFKSSRIVSPLVCRCEPLNSGIEICTGTESFAELLLKSDVFVDKTLFIREFLKGGDKVALITRPRRWGKSMNMDMLKCFLSIEVDDQGQPLPREQCLNHKLFAGGEVVIKPRTGKVKRLAPLKIAQQCPDLVSDYQGQFPVISIGFKDVDGSSYRAIEEGVRGQIVNLYTESHGYLDQYSQAGEKLLKDADEKQLDRYFSDELNQEDIKDSLRFLSKLLHKHFGRRVYILIDEYETPISRACLKLPPKEIKNVLELFQEILGAALKGNPHLEQGLVTGILRLAKADLLSNLNNVRAYTLLDRRFATSYGFTEQEVDELLSKVPTSKPPEAMQRWYNGYAFSDQVVYNPWSIMHYLKTRGKLSRYWVESGGTRVIDPILTTDEMQQDLQTLIAGGTLNSFITRQVSFDNLKCKKDLLSLLLFSGYLSPVRELRQDQYLLSIPNYEVQRVYREWLIEWVSQKLEVDPNEYESLADLLAAGDVETFTKNLQEMLYASASFHQIGPKRAEVFYSGFMMGLLSNLLNRYIIESERESGLGRPDAVLIPNVDHGDRAIILEYKVGQKAEDLAELALEGLAQIADKKYSTQVKTYGHVKRILQVGLAFCGKEVASKYEWIEL
ncbi:MAG: AAA family ATPase [Bacteroidota bacterium]